MNGSTHASVWRIAGPVMLGNISVPLVGIVDTAVVGHLDDPRYLATVAFGAASISLVFFLFGFLRMGTGGLVAQAVGAGDKSALGRVTTRALLLATGLGLAVAACSPLLVEVAVIASGNGESFGELTRAYLYPRLMFAPFSLLNFVIMGVLISLDRAKLALAVQLLLNASNIVLDLLFVNGFGWHVGGVAWASALSECLACLTGLWLVRKQLRQLCSPPSWQEVYRAPGWATLLTVNRDIFVRSACLVACFYSLPLIGARLGEGTLAANGVLLNLFLLTSYTLDGFAHAAEVQTGTAYGASNKRLMRAHLILGASWATGCALVLSVIFAIFGNQLIALMTSLPDVQAIAKEHLFWLVATPVISVLAFQMDGVYFGTTQSRTLRNAMLWACALFALLLWICVPIWQNDGLWFAFCAFMLSRGLFLLAMYPSIERTLNQTRVH